MYGRPKHKPPVRVPPGVAVMSDEIAERFYGSSGEWLVPAKPEAAPPPPQPLQIEPPPWAGQEGDLSLAPLAAPDPGPPLDALSALKADEPFDPPPLDLGPPMEYPPLVRPLPPEPDWRQEEIERDRLRAADAQAALETTPNPYPAPRNAQKRLRWP